MTESISAETFKAIERELYTRSFYEFVKRAWQEVDAEELIDNWHIEVLCDHLQAVHERKIKRLLINISPGSGKSMIVNVLFPAWVWTHTASARIISTSYKEKLAIRDSMRTRRLIESDWYQSLWPTKLQDDQNSKGSFENQHRGAREASAIGSLTGSRGNIVIVDDPHSVDDAKSSAKRQSAVDTFLQAIPSRLNKPRRDCIIVVMQRLHVEDVAGAILERPALNYTHLCIPYFADGEDRAETPIGWKDTRALGESMFPEHFGVEEMEAHKCSMGPFDFAGQFQQNPVPQGEGYFETEWFKRFEPFNPGNEPEGHVFNYYMTSDHAPGGGSRNDYNVFRIWGIDQDRQLWLVDSFRKQCLMDEAIGVARDEKTGRASLAATGALPLIRKWKPLTWFAENDNTWAAIKSFVNSAMLETNVFCHIEAMPTKGAGDKEGKASAYRARSSMGMVRLPKGPVGDETLAEYVSFPVGKHDDQVDADGMIARALADTTSQVIEPRVANREEESYNSGGGRPDDDSLLAFG